MDQRVAEAALAACPQLEFGTRHGIDRLCYPCRWVQAQRPPRRSGCHDGYPETYFATDVTDAIGARALYPPYLHLPVTASVFWAITLRVQEFDKG